MAHSEGSTESSVLLGGLFLKLGAYGLIRVVLPLFTMGWAMISPVLSYVGVLTVMIVSIGLFSQLDVKRVIACTSIVHMNYGLLGLILGTDCEHGCLMLFMSHGLVCSSLFCGSGWLFDQYGTKWIIGYLFNHS